LRRRLTGAICYTSRVFEKKKKKKKRGGSTKGGEKAGITNQNLRGAIHGLLPPSGNLKPPNKGLLREE